MEMPIIETVLTDMLEEQKVTNQLSADLIRKLGEVEEKVAAFTEKLDHLKVSAPSADIRPFQSLLAEGLMHISKVVKGQPKNVIKQTRFLLFPENNTGYYYKIIFGRIFPWALLFLLSVFIISLGNKYLDASTEMRKEKLKSDHYRQVWDYVYDHSNKVGKKNLQDFWDSSWNYIKPLPKITQK